MRNGSLTLCSKRQLLLVTVDLVIIAFFVSAHRTYAYGAEYLIGLTAVVIPHVFTYYIFDLYNPRRDYRSGKELMRVAAIVLGAFVASSLIASFMAPLHRRFHLFLLLGTLVFIPAWRFLYSFLATYRPIIKNCLIIGVGQSGREVASLLGKYRDSGLRAVGFIQGSAPDVQIGQPVIDDLKLLANAGNIREIVVNCRIDIIVSAITLPHSRELLQALIEISESGVDIISGPDLFALLEERIPLANIDEKWIYLMAANRSTYYRSPLKRALDVTVATIGMILSLPFFIVVPVLIKLTSRGPVFFRQDRLGLGQRVFKTLKFRTMVEPWDDENNHVSTLDNDPRITQLGRILRRTKIDELPQFINILKGEMSIVGPRPISRKEAENSSYEVHIPYWQLRFHLKPGASGWSQVNYPYGASLEEAKTRLEYELFYIKHNSFVLDCLVILKTLKCILHMRGR